MSKIKSPNYKFTSILLCHENHFEFMFRSDLDRWHGNNNIHFNSTFHGKKYIVARLVACVGYILESGDQEYVSVSSTPKDFQTVYEGEIWC